MALTESEKQELISRSSIITVVFFVLFLFVIARQGSRVWFDFARHPNWAPDLGALLVFVAVAGIVLSALVPMTINSLVRLSEVINRDPFESLALVASTLFMAWAAASLLFYRYFERVRVSSGGWRAACFRPP